MILLNVLSVFQTNADMAKEFNQVSPLSLSSYLSQLLQISLNSRSGIWRINRLTETSRGTLLEEMRWCRQWGRSFSESNILRMQQSLWGLAFWETIQYIPQKDYLIRPKHCRETLFTQQRSPAVRDFTVVHSVLCVSTTHSPASKSGHTQASDIFCHLPAPEQIWCSSTSSACRL